MINSDFFVYLHIRPNTNDIHGIFYVGKGNSARLKLICRRNNPHHARILNKYGKNNIIVKSLKCESESHAFKLEVDIIKKLKEMGVSLTNITNGGDGASGIKHSEEIRKKISNAKKGKKHTEETKKKMSNAVRNKISDESRKKMSDSKKGTKHSEETKKKMSDTRKNISDETRKKLSDAKKGKKHSEETKKKMSDTRKNKKLLNC